MSKPIFWWFEKSSNGDIFVKESGTKTCKSEDGTPFKCRASGIIMPGVEKVQSYPNDPAKIGIVKVVFKKHDGKSTRPYSFRCVEFLGHVTGISKPFSQCTSGGEFADMYSSVFCINQSDEQIELSTSASTSSTPDTSTSTPSTSTSSQETRSVYEFSDAGESLSPLTSTPISAKRNSHGAASTSGKSGTDETRPIHSTPKLSDKKLIKKPGKRSMPEDFQPEQLKITAKVPKKSGKFVEIDPEKAVKEEIKAADLGLAKISLGCLEISKHQVRPIADWLVNDIITSMSSFTDESYRPYVVLTKNLSPTATWKSDQANGYKYEVIGGQHNFKASQTMASNHPDLTLFKSRRCQVYRGESLSYQAKAYLGVINNRIAETRRQDTTKEQIMLCRNMFLQRTGHGDEWKKLCHKMVKVSNDRDMRTMTTMASVSDGLFAKYRRTIDMFGRGELKGQTRKHTKKDLKIYPFRTLGGMSEEACHEVIDLVIEGKLELSNLELTARTTQQLLRIKACMMGEIDPTKTITWDQMMERFPEHTGREMLLNMFGQTKFNLHAPPELAAYTKECLAWEERGQGKTHLKGEGGCMAHLLKGDGRNLSESDITKGCTHKPKFSLCIVDKPAEWDMDDLTSAVIWVTALLDGNNDATVAVLCKADETAQIYRAMEDREQYQMIRSCFYYVNNARTSDILEPAVGGMVIACKTKPKSWSWMNGKKHNFLSVEKGKVYRDNEGDVVDQDEKPRDIYKELIMASTFPQQWVLDVCCGTGTGLIASLQKKRNYVGVDRSEDMLGHARGRYNKDIGTDRTEEGEENEDDELEESEEEEEMDVGKEPETEDDDNDD